MSNNTDNNPLKIMIDSLTPEDFLALGGEDLAYIHFDGQRYNVQRADGQTVHVAHSLEAARQALYAQSLDEVILQ